MDTHYRVKALLSARRQMSSIPQSLACETAENESSRKKGDWSLKVGFIGAGTVTGPFVRHWIPGHTIRGTLS
jgi:hypothetical protein